MARILVGYERGEALGHYRRLRPVAQALAGEGHEVTLFLRNPYDCRTQLIRDPIRFVQSPDLVAPNPAERQPKRMGSYSDIMVFAGFGSVETLFTATLAWHTLFEQLRCDLVVCDHSPTLCFAAHGRLPVIQAGDGFTLPPAQGDRFPGFASGRHPTVPVDEIVATMNEVQRRLGGPQVPTVTAPLRSAARLVCTLPAFDPYRESRIDPVIGPTEGLQTPLPPPAAPRIFAYLGLENRVTRAMLAALKRSDLPVEAYVRGMTAEIAKEYHRPGLSFFKAPQPIGEVLARASLVIHHAGSGMALACTSAGRPQIVLPIHDESLLTAKALERSGIGVRLTHKQIEADGIALIAQVAADPRRRERAVAVGEEIRMAGPFRPLEHILQACRAALDSA